MKKQLITTCVILLTLSTIYSCKKGFEKLNIDPINILHTTSDKLLAPALQNSIWPGMSRNRSFTNELMQVTVSQSDGENTVFRYAFRASQSDYLWNAWYVQLTNFRDIDSLSSRGDSLNTSYQGIARICESWLFANLTDTYGDIPYSEALQGRQGNMQPVFDRQKDVYEGLFKKLEEANDLLAQNQAIVATSDPVYNGDVSKWRKLGNSLYLRLLLRVSKKAEVAQKCQDKIKEIAQNSGKYPIMTSNADCARVLWSGGVSSTDPYTSPYVYNVRVQDFRTPAICSYFLDSLNAWSDPRFTSAKPYGSGSIGRLGIAQASGGGWRGVRSGYEPGKADPKGCYFQSYDDKSTGGVWSLQQNPNTGIIMQYAEVQFILAEAALKGWIGANPKGHFYQGIASAINYWVPNFPEDTAAADFKLHLENLSNSSVIWNDTLSTARKMELIHGQKYYALFLTDLQQWFEYRRTGYPNLHLEDLNGLQNGKVMPARLVYPVYVQSANPTNYKTAVAAQGVDQINTNVWWQKP
ncbi:SusD/RagB family nutrient-binding outer membrane lipoprotein [Niabella sp.]|uniref:SusD/RagB family nutrient-binding outer membrane lipoprotein n=1 Tax=Niabella sp. TaxID=1962976 RepID=UPI00262CAA32|nr:SusD/RagB family nutrient-binding outer membrane lipoprotein [Niabella sp.]